MYLYPKKCIKFNQSESRIRSRETWNFARHLGFIYRNGRDSLSLKNRFSIFLNYIQKRVDSKKLKVSTLDIRIKQPELKVSYSKVPSSVDVILSANPLHGMFNSQENPLDHCMIIDILNFLAENFRGWIKLFFFFYAILGNKEMRRYIALIVRRGRGGWYILNPRIALKMEGNLN